MTIKIQQEKGATKDVRYPSECPISQHISALTWKEKYYQNLKLVKTNFSTVNWEFKYLNATVIKISFNGKVVLFKTSQCEYELQCLEKFVIVFTC